MDNLVEVLEHNNQVMVGGEYRDVDVVMKETQSKL